MSLSYTRNHHLTCWPVFTPRWWPSVMLMRTRSERAFTAMRSLRYVAVWQSTEHFRGEDHPYHGSFPLHFGIFGSAQKCSPQPSKSLQDPLGLCPCPWGTGYMFLQYGPQCWHIRVGSCGYQVAGAARIQDTTTCPAPTGPRLPSAT